MRVLIFILIVFVIPALSPSGWAAGEEGSAAAESNKPSEEGIPVTSELVKARCSTCHQPDDKGNLSRISWERTTPEGWQQAIKRMVRLHDVRLSPPEARRIVRYLSDNHGLAPEEAAPVMYIAERRLVDEKVPHPSLQKACVVCHAAGRPMSWRRSKEEWRLLINMHVGYFPVADFQGFYNPPLPPWTPPPAPGTDTRDPVDQAVDFLGKNYPLHTPEWSAWQTTKRAPKLAGRWLISGSQLGRGPVLGEVTIEAGARPDEFTTQAILRYIAENKVVKRTGKAIVYTGYAWRGRTTRDGGSEPNPEQLREVMMVSRDQSRIEGRWFWGAYDEFGVDVTLIRLGTEPVVLAAAPEALRAGSTSTRLKIFGANFGDDVQAGDLDLGSGVEVKRIVDHSADVLTVEVEVSKEASPGRRDVAVGRAVRPAAIAVYDAVDYLKVTPEAAMARLGGGSIPKGYQQFEAVAYHRGPDGKPLTSDDVNLGAMEVDWSVEEHMAVYGDDDMDFVGKLDKHGFFTPAIEGPNPKRRYDRNNYGDVWVVGTLDAGDGIATRDGEPATGRAHLIVTIPLYVRYDQPEVAE